MPVRNYELRILIGIVLISFLLLGACTPSTTPPVPMPTPIPTPTPTPNATQDIPSPLPQEEHPTTLPSKTTDGPEKTEQSKPADESDIIADALGIQYIANDYCIEQILPSAFGLPGQLALLPNGDIIFSDSSYPCIRKLSNGTISIIVEGYDIKKRAIAAMPDGRVCYTKCNGQLMLIDPSTGNKESLGQTAPGDVAHALAADSSGNVYAATNKFNLYRFTPDGERITIATDLPWEVGHHISDIDVSTDGTIYIAGWHRFIAVSPDGVITTITDDLHSEPTWCEIDPEGNVYIKDLFSGVRRFDPKTGILTSLPAYAIRGKDILAISANEFIFVEGETDLFCSYNLKNNEYTPLFVNAVNSDAFAADAEDGVFLATPTLESALKPHVIRLQADGTKQDFTELSFTDIVAANVDRENRLCLATSDGFYRVEKDGSIVSFTLKKQLPQIFPRGDGDFAVGPEGKWYCIATNYNDSVKVYVFDGENKITFLPITFDNTFFGDNYQTNDVSIDINNDGQLVLMITAHGSEGRGPFCQRVYRADANGENLTLIATLDSNRTGGMIDIAVDPQNNMFILSPQENSEVIYRIDQSNTLSRHLVFKSGRDPNALDVDFDGNVWFCTTIGVFRIVHQK